jgi:hypothetical protein
LRLFTARLPHFGAADSGHAPDIAPIAAGCPSQVFVCLNAPVKSARGLAQSKSWRKIRRPPADAKRLGLRRPSAAFTANYAKDAKEKFRSCISRLLIFIPQ